MVLRQFTGFTLSYQTLTSTVRDGTPSVHWLYSIIPNTYIHCQRWYSVSSLALLYHTKHLHPLSEMVLRQFTGFTLSYQTLTSTVRDDTPSVHWLYSIIPNTYIHCQRWYSVSSLALLYPTKHLHPLSEMVVRQFTGFTISYQTLTSTVRDGTPSVHWLYYILPNTYIHCQRWYSVSSLALLYHTNHLHPLSEMVLRQFTGFTLSYQTLTSTVRDGTPSVHWLYSILPNTYIHCQRWYSVSSLALLYHTKHLHPLSEMVLRQFTGFTLSYQTLTSTVRDGTPSVHWLYSIIPNTYIHCQRWYSVSSLALLYHTRHLHPLSEMVLRQFTGFTLSYQTLTSTVRDGTPSVHWLYSIIPNTYIHCQRWYSVSSLALLYHTKHLHPLSEMVLRQFTGFTLSYQTLTSTVRDGTPSVHWLYSIIPDTYIHCQRWYSVSSLALLYHTKHLHPLSEMVLPSVHWLYSIIPNTYIHCQRWYSVSSLALLYHTKHLHPLSEMVLRQFTGFTLSYQTLTSTVRDGTPSVYWLYSIIPDTYIHCQRWYSVSSLALLYHTKHLHPLSEMVLRQFTGFTLSYQTLTSTVRDGTPSVHWLYSIIPNTYIHCQRWYSVSSLALLYHTRHLHPLSEMVLRQFTGFTLSYQTLTSTVRDGTPSVHWLYSIIPNTYIHCQRWYSVSSLALLYHTYYITHTTDIATILLHVLLTTHYTYGSTVSRMWNCTSRTTSWIDGPFHNFFRGAGGSTP